MRLPFFRAKDTASEPTPPQRPKRSSGAPPPPDDATIAAARTQARRRLVGAVLLLTVGVIGFPLLFETQPRPLPRDTPIVLSAEAQAARAAATPVAPPPLVPADAGVEPVAPGLAANAASQPAAAATAAVKPPTAVPAASKPTASKPTASAAPPPASPAARASAPTAAPKAAAGRWIVQVGAYNDMERLRAARAKLQLLGYASYTQDVDSPTGKRTRVRVGPFKSRAEADAVAARVKAAGLQAAVLAP
ncbi:MAG: SPOR domain-containing protein [Ideonella sp. WA131b]|jgi:DedD protein|nr:SPOR domain-containing protein [Ideonella sp. WA131b]